jgi:hypothetical protein
MSDDNERISVPMVPPAPGWPDTRGWLEAIMTHDFSPEAVAKRFAELEKAHLEKKEATNG